MTGAAGPVGRALCALLAADGVEVIAVDRRPMPVIEGVRHEQLDLSTAPLDGLLRDAGAIVHLAWVDPIDEADDAEDLHRLERLLAAAGAAGVDHLVVRTSATVYGAWDTNPVPLTEAEPLRPNPEAAWVRTRAEIEAAVDRHRRRHGHRVAVLRPVVTVSADGPDDLGRALAVARRYSLGGGSVPTQFVHADDVAAAAKVALDARLDGAYNVAPDGWLDTDELSALQGGTPRVAMPRAVARTLEKVGYRSGVSTIPPGYVAYASAPWVVAADRLRAAGWQPSHTNAEAFVEGHAAAPWAMISPRRRQELALGVAGAAIAGGLAGGAALVRSRLRH